MAFSRAFKGEVLDMHDDSNANILNHNGKIISPLSHNHQHQMLPQSHASLSIIPPNLLANIHSTGNPAQ